MHMKNIQEEAKLIMSMTGGDLLQIHNLLDRQFSVLQTRAQVLVSIAGIVVTVTGFSGRIIAGIHFTSQILVVAGLFTVITSAAYTVSKVLTIRWLTAMLEPDSPEKLAEILCQRDRKLMAFRVGSAILLVGLICYAAAISIMLLNPEK